MGPLLSFVWLWVLFLFLFVLSVAYYYAVVGLYVVLWVVGGEREKFHIKQFNTFYKSLNRQLYWGYNSFCVYV